MHTLGVHDKYPARFGAFVFGQFFSYWFCILACSLTHGSLLHDLVFHVASQPCNHVMACLHVTEVCLYRGGSRQQCSCSINSEDWKEKERGLSHAQSVPMSRQRTTFHVCVTGLKFINRRKTSSKSKISKPKGASAVATSLDRAGLDNLVH
jgi:hypothetical protein